MVVVMAWVNDLLHSHGITIRNAMTGNKMCTMRKTESDSWHFRRTSFTTTLWHSFTNNNRVWSFAYLDMSNSSPSFSPTYYTYHAIYIFRCVHKDPVPDGGCTVYWQNMQCYTMSPNLETLHKDIICVSGNSYSRFKEEAPQQMWSRKTNNDKIDK